MFRSITQSWRLLSRREKVLISLLALARVASNALDVLGIALIGLVGAAASGAADTMTLPDGVDLGSSEAVVFLVGAAAAVFALKTIVGIALTRVTLLYIAKIETHAAMQIANSIFRGSASDVQSFSLVDLEWRVLRSTQVAFGGVLGSATNLAADISLAVLIFGFLWATDWRLALLVVFYFACVFLLFQLWSQKFLQRRGVELAEGSRAVHQHLLDMVSSFREISVLSKKDAFLSLLAEDRWKVSRAQATDRILSPVPRLVLELGLILGAFGFLVTQFSGGGDFDASTFGVFLMGSIRLMSALLPIQRAFQLLKFEGPSAEDSQNLLWAVKTKARNPVDPLTETAGFPKVGSPEESVGGLSVQVENVSFSYDNDPPDLLVLDDVSLTCRAGAFVAIIGPSGAGKSTLVDTILGVNRPSRGSVRFGGIDRAAWQAASPGAVAYVPQQPGFVLGTVEQNIALGVPSDEVDRMALWDAIRAADLEDYVNSLPNGIDSSLGRQSDSLSGGQAQRLGIARALYFKPRLLVVDEPTSGLDPVSEERLVRFLRGLRGSCSVVAVAHRMATIEQADVVYVLAKGKIVASGTLADLKKNHPFVKRFIEGRAERVSREQP